MNALVAARAAISGGAALLSWMIFARGAVGTERQVNRMSGGRGGHPRAGGRRRPGRDEGVAAGEVAEALAARLRAGASLPDALGQLAAPEPLREHLAELAVSMRRGVPLAEALRTLAADAPPERRLLVAALQLAARHGGRTADALDGVAGTLRDRRAVTAELAAQTSQARFSAWVLVALPPLFLVLGSLVDRRILGAVATPVGALALVVAGALEAVGFAWTRRILAGGARAVSADHVPNPSGVR